MLTWRLHTSHKCFVRFHQRGCRLNDNRWVAEDDGTVRVGGLITRYSLRFDVIDGIVEARAKGRTYRIDLSRYRDV